MIDPATRGPYLFEQALQTVPNDGVIVELGSIRNPQGQKADGHSTFHWAKSGRQVWSVDIDLFATRLCRELMRPYPNVQVVNMDGVEFLKQFRHKIDLLYLDGAYPDTATKTWHAEAFTKANFAKVATLLVDDVDIEDGGKAGFLKPLAEITGWKEVAVGRQLLMYRPERW